MQVNEQIIGPNPRKMQKMDINDLLMDTLPSSNEYEISYMHKDIINNILISQRSEYIITVSIDGHIKFWRKIYNLIQFVRNFKAHNGLINNLALSKEQDLLCSVGIDKTIKIFDVFNCDLRNIIKLHFVAFCCQFIPHSKFNMPILALSQEKAGKIFILNLDHKKQTIQSQDQGNNNQDHLQFMKIIHFHKHPIKAIKMNWNLNICTSIDQRAFLQVWDPYTFDFPSNLQYKCKIQTQFLSLLTSNSVVIAYNLSPHGKYASIMLKDRTIRIFNLHTGKLLIKISQTIEDIMSIQQKVDSELKLSQVQFQRRMNLQRDLEITKDFLYNPNCQFDQSEQYLIYASFYGIKIYSLKNKTVQKILGKNQHERYVRIALYQGKPMRNPSGSSNAKGQRKATDPNIYTSAFKKNRFYIYSRREPQQINNIYNRDIINQRNTKQQNIGTNQIKMTQKHKEVIIQTTKGDIHILLFTEDCPKTCQNFIKLVKKGYYDGLLFHRVIKGFMNQTGCPRNDGTGGQSIWGGYFQDQLLPDKLRFERPYMVAMANRGPNTNGSQFFITVVACPWLDNKHTIFGRVIKGIECVCQINKIKTDKGDKPLINVNIMNARVV